MYHYLILNCDDSYIYLDATKKLYYHYSLDFYVLVYYLLCRQHQNMHNCCNMLSSIYKCNLQMIFTSNVHEYDEYDVALACMHGAILQSHIFYF